MKNLLGNSEEYIQTTMKMFNAMPFWNYLNWTNISALVLVSLWYKNDEKHVPDENKEITGAQQKMYVCEEVIVDATWL